MVAVEDPHPVPGQPGGAARRQRVDDRPGLPRRIPDQRRGQPEFHAVELVVDGLIGNRQRVAALAAGGVDRRLDAQDHRLHQLDDRGEQQGAVVLLLRGPLEQFVKPLGPEEVLQHRAGHDADRAAVDERLKSLR